MNKKLKLSLLGTLIATSFLAITLPIVSCSSSTSSDIELFTTNDMGELKIYVTELLTSKMEDAKTINDKKNLAKEWSKGKVVPDDVEALFSSNLKLKDSDENEVGYNIAIENITFETEITIPNSGSIPGIKLRVNFKDGYHGDVWIQTDDLGSIEINYIEDSIENVKNAVIESLKKKMKETIGYENQLELADSWKVGSLVPKYVEDEIRANLIFNYEDVKYDDVVDSVTFETKTLVKEGENILGPKIKISFDDQYISQDPIIIETGDLGNTSPPIANILIPNNADIIEVAKNLTDGLIKELNSYPFQNTRKDQLRFANRYASGAKINNPISEIGEIIFNGLNFTNSRGYEIKGLDAIDSAIVTNKITIPNAGEVIKGPTFEIKLKDDQYISQDPIIIETGDLGIALSSTELFIEDSVIERVENILTQSLFDKMQHYDINNDRQLALAESWKVGTHIPNDSRDLIKNVLVFKDINGNPIKYGDSVNRIIFETDTELPISGNINGPILRVVFNDSGYFFDGEILLQIGSLGDVNIT